MNKITDTRIMIIDKEGVIHSYPNTIGIQHQDIIDEYARKKNYDYSNVEYVTMEGNSVFYNVGNNYAAAYLPPNLTDEQLYQLELLSENMDDIEYMEVRKFIIEDDKLKYQEFTLEDQIGDRFSKEVIQSYYQNNQQTNIAGK